MMKNSSASLPLVMESPKGKPHKQKACEKICPSYQEQPDWFKRGIDLSLLAPSALNQMKTKFDFVDAKVVAKAGIGFFTKSI